MNQYRWDDIRKLMENISISDIELNNKNIVLFGSGRSGSSAYHEIKKQYKVYAFSDNNKKVWGGIYESLPVISPKQLKTIKNVFVILTVTGQYYLPIKKQLMAMGITCITYMEYILIHHYDKFEMVYYQLLEDEFSRKTYLNLLMSHLTFDTTGLKEIFVKNQYFEIPEFYVQSTNEIFIDCGAYTGDTLETYINTKSGTFKRIYSFEPTEKVYTALCARKERLLKEWALEEDQIVIEKKVITSKSGIQYFIENAEDKKWNRIIKENQIKSKQIEAISLDQYFMDKKEEPTFIKADIEGAEIEMLKGAKRIITEKKPLLAICIYHRIEDLYEIPILLKQFYSSYKMSIRHHMPNYYETVLYCY